MKKNVILVLIIAIFIISCNNSTQENNGTDTISEIATNEQVKTIDFVPEASDTIIETKLVLIEDYKYLSEIFHKEDSLYSKFEKYIGLINSEVSSEAQILEIFKLRDELINYASLKVEKYYYPKGENNQNLWMKVEKELISIGFLPVYTEGMFVQLDISEILNDEVKKYASEPFKLKIKFENEYAKSVGGEYPYAALGEYLSAFEPGYKLFDKYRNTKYYKEIEDKFQSILIEFVDIHKIGNMCYEGELHFEDYPWSTICNMPELFIKRFPNTVFTPIFKKLKENISEFSPKEKNYLIVTDKIEGDQRFEKAKTKVFSYLEKGIDVLHSVQLKNKEAKEITYIVYRFYSDKNRAESELLKISENLKKTEIITVIVDDNGNVKEI